MVQVNDGTGIQVIDGAGVVDLVDDIVITDAGSGHRFDVVEVGRRPRRRAVLRASAWRSMLCPISPPVIRPATPPIKAPLPV